MIPDINIPDEPEYLNIDESLYLTRLSPGFRSRTRYKPADPGKILSFIPGTVVDIVVREGQQVKRGDLLLILDAMKMKNRLTCPFNARIKSIGVKKGDRVARGIMLIELDQDIT
jgi:biotin carboxyl carrier protein